MKIIEIGHHEGVFKESTYFYPTLKLVVDVVMPHTRFSRTIFRSGDEIGGFHNIDWIMFCNHEKLK